MTSRNHVFALCSGASALLLGVGVWHAVEPPPRAPRAAVAPTLHLRVALLVEREGEAGEAKEVASGAPLRRGDRLQLTLRPESSGHLMVGTVATGGEITALYPRAEQSGEVRGGWAYALPAPHRRYTFDGAPTRVVLLLRRSPLPALVGERRALLRRALTEGGARGAPHGPITLSLEDGRPVRVEVARYSGNARVVAVVALNAMRRQK